MRRKLATFLTAGFATLATLIFFWSIYAAQVDAHRANERQVVEAILHQLEASIDESLERYAGHAHTFGEFVISELQEDESGATANLVGTLNNFLRLHPEVESFRVFKDDHLVLEHPTGFQGIDEAVSMAGQKIGDLESRRLPRREGVIEGPFRQDDGSYSILASFRRDFSSESPGTPGGGIWEIQMSIPVERFLADIRANSAPAELASALRVQTVGSERGFVVFGDERLFEDGLVEELTGDFLPGRIWSLAAMPAAGWLGEPASVRRLRWGAVTLALLLGLLVGRQMHLGMQREDLIQRIRADLVESESRYQQIFENSPAPKLLIHARYGLLLDANVAADRFYGYEPGGLKRRSLADLDVSAHTREFARIAEAARTSPGVMETIHHRTSGEVRDVEVSYAPMKLRDEDVVYAIVQDISERKIAERALQENERRYRTLFELCPSGILVEDANGRIVDVSPAFCRLVGYDYDSLIGMRVHDLTSPENKKTVDRNIERTLSGERLDHVVKSRRQDGSWRFYQLRENRITLPDGRPGILAIVDDISEKRAQEEELRRYAKVYETMTDGVAAVDEDGRIRFCNPAMGLLAGRPMHHLIGRTPEQAWEEERGGEMVIDTRGHTLAIRTMKKPDGRERVVSVKSFDLNSDPPLKVHIYRDVTRQKRAEMQVRESEASLRDFLESANDLIFIARPDGMLDYVNRSWREALEIRPGDRVSGHSIHEYFHQESASKLKVFFSEMLRGEGGHSIQARMIARTGREIIVEGSLNARWEGGEPVSVRGIFRDITARRSAEEELRASEERFRQIAEALRPTLWMSTANFDRLIYISPSFDELWGRSRSEVYGGIRSILKSIHVDDRGRILSILRDRSVERAFSFECRILRPTGEVRWMLTRTFPIRGESGEVERIAGITEDVTESKLAQEALQNAQREREQFYRFLIHDLNKPLAAIIGLAGHLERREELSSEARNVADLIERSAGRLRDTVSHFLSYEQLRADTAVGETKDIDVWEYILDIARLLREKHPQHEVYLDGIPIEKGRPPDALRIAAPLSRFLRIVQNLLDNALKYGEKSVDVTGEIKDGNLLLRFWNDGPGLPKELEKGVFSEFYRGAEPQAGSFGLGLPAARKLTLEMGGDIWCEKPERGGIAFVARIPVTGAPSGASPQFKNHIEEVPGGKSGRTN